MVQLLFVVVVVVVVVVVMLVILVLVVVLPMPADAVASIEQAAQQAHIALSHCGTLLIDAGDSLCPWACLE